MYRLLYRNPRLVSDPFVADTGECLADPPVSFGAEGVSPFAAGDLSMIGFEGGLDGETMGSSKGAVVRPTSIEGRLCDDLKVDCSAGFNSMYFIWVC